MKVPIDYVRNAAEKLASIKDPKNLMDQVALLLDKVSRGDVAPNKVEDDLLFLIVKSGLLLISKVSAGTVSLLRQASWICRTDSQIDELHALMQKDRLRRNQGWEWLLKQKPEDIAHKFMLATGKQSFKVDVSDWRDRLETFGQLSEKTNKPVLADKFRSLCISLPFVMSVQDSCQEFSHMLETIDICLHDDLRKLFFENLKLIHDADEDSSSWKNILGEIDEKVKPSRRTARALYKKSACACCLKGTSHMSKNGMMTSNNST